jgi:hypothetical protein
MKLGDTVLVNNVVWGDKRNNWIRYRLPKNEVIKTIKLKDGTILSSKTVIY